MSEILYKALSFVFIILIAYILKKKKFFSPTDYIVVTKITLNITLPAAVIYSFANFEKDSALFVMVALGLGFDVLLWMIGFIISKSKQRNLKIHYMMNLPCFNIGSFTMPFAQNFLGSYGVVATCMFDTGNAIMSSGGTYALTSAVVGNDGGEKISMINIFKKLIKSVPFDIYIIMFIVALLDIKIPQPLLAVCSTIAPANGFMSMFMLGLMLELDIEKSHLIEVSKTLFIRYLICTIMALIVYFLTPFSQVLRQVLVLVLFSPTSALVPAFTHMFKGDTAVASFSGSASIIISVFIMTFLVVIMGV